VAAIAFSDGNMVANLGQFDLTNEIAGLAQKHMNHGREGMQ